MRWVRAMIVAGLAAALAASGARASEVTVKGVHLCCAKCVKAAADALAKVKGVSGAACEQGDKEEGYKGQVTFQAENQDAARAGLQALTRAGFYGEAAVDGKPLKRRGGQIQKKLAALKTDQLTLRGAHLCCAKCEAAATAAVQSAAKDAQVAVNAKKRVITVTGKQIPAAAVVAALRKAGFNAFVPGLRGGKGKKKQAAK